MSKKKDTMISWGYTLRGFRRGEFKDAYEDPCSVQLSSRATVACIWLGRDDLSEPARMHLTQEQVAELLPVLKHFVKTGELP